MTTLARAASVAVATVVLCATGIGPATPLTSWSGQFNPAALLDTTQVATRSLPPGMVADPAPVDCWDDWSCALTDHGLPPEYDGVTPWSEVDPAGGPWLDADYQPHADCSLVSTPNTALIVCPDGYTETS